MRAVVAEANVAPVHSDGVAMTVEWERRARGHRGLGLTNRLWHRSFFKNTVFFQGFPIFVLSRVDE